MSIRCKVYETCDTMLKIIENANMDIILILANKKIRKYI